MMNKVQVYRSGFTLVDVIIIVAILAVMITSIFPIVSASLARSSMAEEEELQKQIIDAFDVYLKHTGQIPANVLTATNYNQAWNRTYTAFTSDTVVTNLSRDQMRDDVYDNRRALWVEEETVALGDASYNVYYIAVLSAGDDGCYGTAPCGNTAIPDDFGAVSPNVNTFNMDDYRALEAAEGSDDVITKYTNIEIARQNYNEAIKKRDRIYEALDFYAGQKRLRAESMVTEVCQAAVDARADLSYSIFNCYEDIRDGSFTSVENMPDTQLFVPPSLYMIAGSVSGESRRNRFDVGFVSGGSVERSVISDVTDANDHYGIGGSTIRNNETDHATRKAGMKALMSVIGLSDNYCCHDVQKFYNSDTGRWESMPFYYYSNPRRAGTSCRSAMYAREVRMTTNACGRCTAAQENSNAGC